MSYKKELVKAIIETLKVELEKLSQSAKSAHEAATHEESKAEDSHDTRGLEAAYLAGAQNARILELQRTIHYFQHGSFRDFTPESEIGVGAWVQLENNQKKYSYFVATRGGGTVFQFAGQTIQLITPQSPLGEQLIGKSVGDEVESPAQSRIYEILLVK